MATRSTVPTVKAQMVTKFTTALATSSLSGGQLQVKYAWPGAATEHESVFLGYHPSVDDISVEVDHELATIKAGRKQRQEEYVVPFTIYCFRPDLADTAAATCESRAFTILGELEDEFADDTRIGLAVAVVQKLTIDAVTSRLVRSARGWACVLTVDVAVDARLT